MASSSFVCSQELLLLLPVKPFALSVWVWVTLHLKLLAAGWLSKYMKRIHKIYEEGCSVKMAIQECHGCWHCSSMVVVQICSRSVVL